PSIVPTAIRGARSRLIATLVRVGGKRLRTPVWRAAKVLVATASRRRPPTGALVLTASPGPLALASLNGLPAPVRVHGQAVRRGVAKREIAGGRPHARYFAPPARRLRHQLGGGARLDHAGR